VRNLRIPKEEKSEGFALSYEGKIGERAVALYLPWLNFILASVLI
jgi:hypothetical protein